MPSGRPRRRRLERALGRRAATRSRKRGRVVDCTGLENRRRATVREFESHRFRQKMPWAHLASPSQSRHDAGPRRRDAGRVTPTAGPSPRRWRGSPARLDAVGGAGGPERTGGGGVAEPQALLQRPALVQAIEKPRRERVPGAVGTDDDLGRHRPRTAQARSRRASTASAPLGKCTATSRMEPRNRTACAAFRLASISVSPPFTVSISASAPISASLTISVSRCGRQGWISSRSRPGGTVQSSRLVSSPAARAAFSTATQPFASPRHAPSINGWMPGRPRCRKRPVVAAKVEMLRRQQRGDAELRDMGAQPARLGDERLGDVGRRLRRHPHLPPVQPRRVGLGDQDAPRRIVADQPDGFDRHGGIEAAHVDGEIAGRAAAALLEPPGQRDAVLLRPGVDPAVAVEAPGAAGDKAAVRFAAISSSRSGVRRPSAPFRW